MFWLEEYGAFPNGGGWMDQDYYLLEDIKTYKRIQQRLKWEQGDDTDAPPKPARVAYPDDVYEEQVDAYHYGG